MEKWNKVKLEVWTDQQEHVEAVGSEPEARFCWSENIILREEKALSTFFNLKKNKLSQFQLLRCEDLLIFLIWVLSRGMYEKVI